MHKRKIRNLLNLLFENKKMELSNDCDYVMVDEDSKHNILITNIHGDVFSFLTKANEEVYSHFFYQKVNGYDTFIEITFGQEMTVEEITFYVSAIANLVSDSGDINPKYNNTLSPVFEIESLENIGEEIEEEKFELLIETSKEEINKYFKTQYV